MMAELPEAAKPRQVHTPHTRFLFTHQCERSWLNKRCNNPWCLTLTPVTRETAGFSLFSTRSAPAQKSHTKCRTKNDVLPHESTRCNYVRQRETTKLANISVVRRQTRILDAQIAVVSQKKTYNAGVRNKSSILKYADSLQPLPTCRGMQTFYWCMKSAGLVQEFPH